jgi:hypothetical protein
VLAHPSHLGYFETPNLFGYFFPKSTHNNQHRLTGYSIYPAIKLSWIIYTKHRQQ